MISTKLFSNAITETMVSILYVYMNFLYDYIDSIANSHVFNLSSTLELCLLGKQKMWYLCICFISIRDYMIRIIKIRIKGPHEVTLMTCSSQNETIFCFSMNNVFEVMTGG